MLETIVVATTKVTTVVGDGNLWCVVTVQEGRKCEKERGVSKMDSLSGVTKVMKLTVDVMCWINNGDRGETEAFLLDFVGSKKSG